MIPSGAPAPARPSIVRPLWSLPGPALGGLLAAGLLTAPVGPLGGAVQRDLHLSATMAATVVASYVVATAALVAPGYLLGRRWPTAVGVPALLFVLLGSLLCAFAPGAAVLALGRVLGGLGAGAVVGVLFALSGQLAQGRAQARLVLGGVLGVALLLGPVVSGVLAQTLTWRLAFLVDVPVAALALLGTVGSGIAMSVVSGSRSAPAAVPVPTAPSSSETPSGGPAH